MSAADHDLLVLDVETNGLPDFKAPSSAQHQARVASIGFMLCTPDGRALRTWYGVIKPVGWTLPRQLEAMLGFDQALLDLYGHDIQSTMDYLFNMVGGWRRPLTFVAHNLPFDQKLLRIESERAGMRGRYETLIQPMPTFCTMLGSVHVLKLPPTPKMVAAGFRKPKSPKLEEAYAFFNEGRPPKAAHNALADCFSCLDVFLALKKQGVAMTPRPARVAESAVEEIA